MQKTPYHSYKNGNLAKGCRLCVQGRKTVLFITGVCPKHCFYCPISEQKFQKDVIFANERKITSVEECIEEIKACDSYGVGITGGDPLARLERTVEYIKRLKKTFGKKFHIHLYTPLVLVNENSLKRLYSAGLDEIRFHPDINQPKEWNKIEIAQKYDWDVGAEIPLVPGKFKETTKLALYLAKIKIDFLNLNELEYSDTNAYQMDLKKFRTKNNLSYGIARSQELGLKLLKYLKGKKVNVHYCTATLKDKVQMANRMMLRAENTAKKYDFITDDNTLVRGAVYLKELMPGFRYREKLDSILKKPIKKNQYIKTLNKIKDQLMKDFRIKKDLIDVDENKLRLITSAEIVNDIKESLDENLLKKIKTDKKLLCDKGLYLAIVEEYPTFDALEVDVEFL